MDRPLTIDDLKKIHLDVTSPAARQLTELILGRIDDLNLTDQAPGTGRPAPGLGLFLPGQGQGPGRLHHAGRPAGRGLLRGSDGREGGQGGHRFGRPGRSTGPGPGRGGSAKLKPLFAQALDQAAEDAAKFETWGRMHRLKLNHFLGRVPLIGSPLPLPRPPGRRLPDDPAQDGPPGDHREARFLLRQHGPAHLRPGRPQRQLLSFVGRPRTAGLGSTAMLDQVPMWQAGRYIQDPPEMGRVRATFKHRIIIGRK